MNPSWQVTIVITVTFAAVVFGLAVMLLVARGLRDDANLHDDVDLDDLLRVDEGAAGSSRRQAHARGARES